MLRSRLILVLVIVGSMIAMILPIFPIFAPTPAAAQSCTVVDTITVDAIGTVATGSYTLKAGYKYQLTISGVIYRNSTNLYRDARYITSDNWGSQSAFGALITSNNSWVSVPIPDVDSYRSDHTYVYTGWGGQQPLSIRGNDPGAMTGHTGTLTVSVCEFSSPVPAWCGLVATVYIPGNHSGAVSGYFYPGFNTINGHSYKYVVEGVYTDNASIWTAAAGDPQYNTSNGFTSSSRFNRIVFSISPGQPDADDTTYSTSHQYVWTRTGNGSDIGIGIYSPSGSNRGGFRVLVCDDDALPTPTLTPTGTITAVPTLPPISGNWSFPLLGVDRYGGQEDTNFFTWDRSPFTALNLPVDPGTRLINVALSDQPGAFVHSVIAGTVTDVYPLNPACHESIVLSVFSLPFHCPKVNGTNATQFFSYADAYVVQVEIQYQSGRFLFYLVSDPRVTSGQEVSEGCVLGLTLHMEWRSAANLNYGALGQAGYTEIMGLEQVTPGYFEDSLALNIAPLLTKEPQSKTCQPVDEGSSCILVDNPNFSGNARGWTLANGAVQPQGTDTAIILPNDQAYARQRRNLDPTLQYTITVFYRLYTNPAVYTRPVSISVKLGREAAEIIDVNRNTQEVQSITIPGATYTPVLTDSVGNYYDLEVHGASGGTVQIDYICVADANEIPPSPAGGCVLINPEFDFPASSPFWTVSGDVNWNTLGTVILYDTDTISQPLTLSPKNDAVGQDYRITVDGRNNQTSGTVTVAYSWGGAASGTFEAFGVGLFQSHDDTFTVNAKATNDLEISISGGSGAAQLDRVCITTADGDDVPGYKPPPPMSPVCKSCSYTPTSDVAQNIVELAQYLGCVLNQLLYCQIRTILYGIWQVVTYILAAIGYFRAWLSGTMLNAWTAFNGDLRVIVAWFNGALTNFMNSFVPTGAGGSSTNLWDALIALFNAIRDIIVSVVDLLMGVLALAQLLVTVIINGLMGVLIGVIGAIPALISALISSFNTAAASPPPGSLECTTPGTLLYAPCVGLYILDQTIFAGPVRLLIPLAMGAGGIKAIIWAIGRVRRVLS